MRFLDDEAPLETEVEPREKVLCEVLVCEALFMLELRKTPRSKTNTIAARKPKAARRPILRTNLGGKARPCL